MTFDFFEKNLAALRARDPQLAARVDAVRTTAAVPVEVRPGWFDVICDGAWLYNGDPEPAVQASLDLIKGSDHPRIIVGYGIGLGQHVLTLYPTLHPATAGVYLIEESLELFTAALMIGDWCEIISNKRVDLFVGLSPDDFQAAMKTSLETSATKVLGIHAKAFMHHAPAMLRRQAYFLEIPIRINAAEDELLIEAIAPAEDAYIGFMSTMQNLAACAGVPELSILRGEFAGKVGIAVSTGPSLSHSFGWLREAQHHTVIACADSALRILLREGITPHLVGCLERVPETKLLFADLPPLPQTYLLSNPIIWPETFQGYPGPKLLMLRSIVPLPLFFPESEHYVTGISVSHLIYKALEVVGCHRILLVGQDLAYDRHSARTHADGMPELLIKYGQKHREESVKQSTDPQCGVMVEGNDGAPILTGYWYNRFRSLLTHLIRESGVETVNVIPADYGAKIQLAKWSAPGDALALLGERCDARAVIATQVANATILPVDQFHVRQKAVLRDVLDRVKNYNAMLLDVLDNISQFSHRYNINHYNTELFTPLLRRVEYILNQMGEDHVIAYLIAGIAQGSIIKLAQHAEYILAKNMPEHEKFIAKVDNVFHVISNMLLWGGRVARFLERDCVPHYPNVIFPQADPRAHEYRS